jgi:hypothetical protein
MTEITQQLHDLKQRHPFVPFVIILKDGRRFEVTRRMQYGFSEHLMGVIDDQDHTEDFRPSDIAEIQVSHPVS